VLTFFSQSPAAALEYENKEDEKLAKGQDLDFAEEDSWPAASPIHI